MIVEKGKYYLYRHIRLDKNEPFYIGISGKTSRKHRRVETEYSRAYQRSGRGSIWNRIVNKTIYEVEILLESDNLDFIKNKEIEFIKLYGRINLGTGILANLTDGGDGVRNHIHSEESKIKIGLKSKQNAKKGKLNPKSKTLFIYDLDGNFVKELFSLTEACNFAKVKVQSISSCLSRKSKSSGGFQWFRNFKGDKIQKVTRNINFSGVYMIEQKDEKIVGEFSSTVEAAKFLGKQAAPDITKVCNGKRKIAYGYKWRYKNDK